MPEQPTDHMLACSLNRAAMQERQQRWQRLCDSALLDSTRDQGGAALRFQGKPAVATELGELVRLERECCPFLGFSITQRAETIDLRIEGPPEAAAMIDSFSAASAA